MSFYIKYFVSLVFSFAAIHTHAQDNLKYNFFEFKFGTIQPQGTIIKAFPLTDFNLGLHYHRQISSDKPMFWGVYLDYSQLANKELSVEEFVNLSAFLVDYKTTTNLLNFGGSIRFYPDINFWKIYPFVEGNFGARWFYTLTTRTLSDSNTSTKKVNEGNIAPSLGAGAGLHYELKSNFFLTFKVAYSTASTTSYLYPDDNLPLINSSLDGFESRRSSSEFLFYSFGLTFRWSNY